MKFSALIATLAVVQAIDLHRNTTKSVKGVTDDSYDQHYDDLNKDIWTIAKSVQEWSKNGVDQIEESDKMSGDSTGYQIRTNMQNVRKQCAATIFTFVRNCTMTQTGHRERVHQEGVIAAKF